MGTQVIMPQLGESVVEGKVSRWLKKVGDQVKLYEPILEVETDKVTTEVTSAGEGTLLKLYFDEGDVVKAGTLIAFIGAVGETPPAGGAVQVHTAEPALAPPATKRGNGSGARISPVVARIASEYHVDVALIAGTGEGGRVTKKDILAYIENQKQVAPLPIEEGTRTGVEKKLEPWEQPGLGELFRPSEEVFGKSVAAAEPGSIVSSPSTTAAGETVALTGIRKAIADHMVLSKRTSPHVTTVFEVDMSNVAAHRSVNQAVFERDGVKLTFTPYFAAATVAALKQHPLVNSSWSDNGILLHRSINLGIAVSLGADGLIVPVIKNAEALNVLGLARAVNDLADRARRKQLKPDDVQGGTFTITNHGTSGSLFATPIINQPQCAILGVGQIQKRVVVVTAGGVDSIAIKPMCYVGLTFDHRILDGNSADNFVAAIKQALQNWT